MGESNIKNILLNTEDIIAKGGERACYAFPHDSTKLIKVVYTEDDVKQQNKVEHIYMTYLKEKNTDLSQLASYYGEIQTNFGNGAIYERIQDFDGEYTKSFRYYIWKNIISREVQKRLIEELQVYLSKNRILFVDTSLTNIFCKRIDEKTFRLIIVDGLGAKRMGFKFWLYRHSNLYTQYKITRQWQKFIQMYKKDTTRIDVGVTTITRF